ncbi:hypothetical protein BH18ACT1_BH18ACT1_08310 [soil metagenome]
MAVSVARAPRLRTVQVHRSSDLRPDYRTRHDGIPVTNPLRTMVDLGAVLGPQEVEDALDRGLVARLFSVAAVEWALNDLARSGRSGCGVLRAVLDERALGRRRPDGVLEPRMARLLRDHGLPAAAFQHPVVAEETTVLKIDFAYVEVRLAIEVDGYDTHSTRRRLQSDLERQNTLVALGWTPLRFTWHDVVRRPGLVATRIREVLCTLRSTGSPVLSRDIPDSRCRATSLTPEPCRGLTGPRLGTSPHRWMCDWRRRSPVTR